MPANPDAPHTPAAPVAVIGLSARYAGGVQSPDDLWSLLKAGIDPIQPHPTDRWDRGFLDSDRSVKGRSYIFAGGYLDRIDAFDADFFGISAREAQQMDPQQRLLLELAWEAFEDAGLVPADQAGSATGVYVGLSGRDYAELLDEDLIDAYTNLGLSASIASNRVSYVFDLKGPSLTVDTACSSGMVALHQAMLALRRGECTQALVGAVNLMASPASFIGFSKASMLSPAGRCTSFDADGAGYVRAEGGGFLLLKPLAAAERDGDRILGVVVASGVNSDGRTMGIALPNPVAQARLLDQVYAEAGLAPDDVYYLEAHGTGTAVGDPIECEAIAKVLGGARRGDRPLRIGSIKSNVGHLENAAAIAGITKVLLAMRHGEIPANLHFRTPNPKIDFEGWKLQVVAEPQPLPDSDAPLHFGVNSFGFGGTNGHCVLRQYRPPSAVPDQTDDRARTGPWREMLVISAQSEAALQAQASRWRDHLRGPAAAASWPLMRANMLHHRSHLAHRLVLHAGSASDAADRLDAVSQGQPAGSSGRAPASALESGRQRVAFVFAGNGPQWWAMGRQLLDNDACFRDAVSEVDEIFGRLAGWSLIDELRRDAAETRMALTEVAQPTLFALQVGVTTLLRAAGIEADAVIGHSVGEAAAAWASGSLTLAQATRVIHQRSLAQSATAGLGRMAALGVSAEEARAAIARVGGFLEVAAVNSPSAVTVAGDPVQLQSLCDGLAGAGKFARMLTLDYPFHTRAMDGIRDGLLRGLDGLTPCASACTFVSTVEGRVVDGKALEATYWWRNIREPVAFADGVSCLVSELGINGFIEIGPHPVLRDYVLQTAKACDATVQVLVTLRRPREDSPVDECELMRQAVQLAYAQGLADPRVLAPRPMQRLPMPLYAWQRQRHWRGEAPLPGVLRPTRREHPLLGWRASDLQATWEQVLDASRLGWLADHVVQDTAVFPGAGYIEMALAAGRALLGDGPLQLEDLDILKPLALPARGGWPRLNLWVDSADGRCEITSQQNDQVTAHVQCRITRAELSHRPADADLSVRFEALTREVDAATHYATTHRRGLHYGPAFQGVKSLRLDDDGRRAVVRIELSAALGEAGPALQGQLSHPALLDACLQVLLTVLAERDPKPLACIPVRVDRLRWFAPLPPALWCAVTLLRDSPHGGRASFSLHADDGRCVMVLDATGFQKVDFHGSAEVPHLADRWRPDPRAAQPLPAALGQVSWPRELSSPLAWSDEAERELQVLCGAVAARVLRTLHRKSDLPADRPFTNATLLRRLRIAAERRSWLQALADIAVTTGAMRSTQTGLVFGPDAPSETALWRAQMLARPAFAAELMLLLPLADRLPAWLVADDVEAAPPAPNRAFLDAMEDGGPFHADAHAALAELLVPLLAARDPLRVLRIVQLHAGSGGASAALLPHVPSQAVDVALTDPDGDAVDKLLRQFGGHRAVRGQVLALSAAAPPVAPADLLICADGLQAAAMPPAQALARAAEWLAPGGWLLLAAPRPGPLATLLKMAEGQGPDQTMLPDAEGWTALLKDAGGWESVRVHTVGAGVVIAAQRHGDRSAAPTAPSDPTEASRGWLLLSDADGPGEAFAGDLAQALAARAGVVRRLHIDPGEDAPELARRIAAAAMPDDTVVQLAGLAVQADDPLAMQHARCLPLIALAHGQQGLDGMPPQPLKARLVSCGAQAGPCGPAGAARLDPAQAAAWGLARVLANEHPGLALRMVDVQLPLDRTTAARLADELLGGSDETEVLLNADGRWLQRVEAAVQAHAPAALGERLALVNGPGGLDGLALRATPRCAPAAGQVEVEVRAAGLNFRDVLWAMNMLPEEAVADGFSGATIGMECAGTVVAVGDGVAQFKPGDSVIGFASGCFASHVTTAAGALGPMPPGLSYAEAATIPTTFLTAWYALTHLARLEPGERVLIHGAAGGVGLAAIQIARLRGAEVFATAGNDDKRRLVRRYGADHVLDSRSLAFADDVMGLTGGQGVDVVLNSLAGEAITKNLQILRPFGRLLEIGKRDLYANSRIGLRPFRINISYFGIDADTLLLQKPTLARRMFDELLAELRAGTLRPLPCKAFPVERAAAAFRLMQRSRHVGKIVLVMPTSSQCAPAVQPASWRATGAGTWLVTGGLGGFGLATAKWLVARGVCSLVLMSRRGDASDEAREGIAILRAAGAEVRAHAADVGNNADVARVLADLRATMPPLVGIVHAAMVLDDAPVHLLDRARLDRVLAPKLAGAWNLHRLTLDDPLQHFVVYSSATVMFGNPGQGNYVAANQYLQAFAQWRRAQGRPALSVAWGAIRDVGVVTRIEGLEEMLQKRSGIAALDAADALQELGLAMARGEVAASVSALDLSRGAMLSTVRAPRMAALRPVGGDAADVGGQTLAERWPDVAVDARRPLLLDVLRSHLARILGTTAAQIDVEKPLADLGMDSLMAVELAGSLEQETGRPVSVMQMIQASSTTAVVDLLAASLEVQLGA